MSKKGRYHILSPSLRAGRRLIDSAEFPEFDRGRGIPIQADHPRAGKKQVQRVPLQGVQLAVAYGRDLSCALRGDKKIAVLDPRQLLSVLVIDVVAHW